MTLFNFKMTTYFDKWFVYLKKSMRMFIFKNELYVFFKFFIYFKNVLVYVKNALIY